ncbi:hypothetical protein L1887_43288 [Cichorium endivia]|nr:hypothetical protein L1887_43288 [Cichorium endivia]
MCVIFWTVSDAHYDLVIASNRDEFLARPTLPASWHAFDLDSEARILSARDASGGGTWLGVTRSGAFATLTNFTEATPELPPGMERFESRGQLVRDWLLSSHPSPQTRQEVEKDIQQYLNNVGDKLQSFPGFNLLVGKVSKQGTVLGYITNRDSQGELAKPQPKIFDPPKIERVRMCRGMSNSILDQPWPKVHTGSQAFDAALARASTAPDQEQLIADLFSVLAFSSNPTQRSELRNSILIPPVQLPTPAGDGDCLEAGDGDTVKVTHAILRDATATLGVLLENTNALKTLDDLALHGARGVGVVRGAEAAVGGTTVELSQMADTDSLAQVDVAGERGGADVEPVGIVRGLLLEVTGLDNVDPDGHLDLAWKVGAKVRATCKERVSECCSSWRKFCEAAGRSARADVWCLPSPPSTVVRVGSFGRAALVRVGVVCRDTESSRLSAAECSRRSTANYAGP